jgi:putative ABC transport system permease protein
MNTLQNQQIKVLWTKIALPYRNRWLWFCMVLGLGLGSLSGIEYLLSTVEKNLYEQARDLLGADLSISSWQSLDDPWTQKAQERLKAEGFDQSESFELAGMAKTQKHAPFLISLKAVSPSYPLRGELVVQVGDQIQKNTRLTSGDILISQGISEQKQIKVGDEITIDQLTLKVKGILIKEPDGGMGGALSFAPRMIISIEDLKKTKLITFGSRVKTKKLFALNLPDDRKVNASTLLEQVKNELIQTAAPHVEIESYLNAQPNTLRLFERIAIFFSMVSLVSLSLCLSAFFVSLYTLVLEQQAQISILKALGLNQKILHRFYLQFAVFIGFLSGTIGILIGTLIALGLGQYAKPYFNIELTFHFQWLESLILLCASISLSILILRVILSAMSRQSIQEMWGNIDLSIQLTTVEKMILIGGLLSLMIAYLYLSSGSLDLSFGFVLSLLVLVILTHLLIGLMFWALRLFKKTLMYENLGTSLRFGLDHLLGYQQKYRLMLISLSIGFSLICSLEFVSALFQQNLSLDDAQSPQFFMIDIQPDQEESILALAKSAQMKPPQLNTLVRARLSAINQKTIKASSLDQSTPALRLRARTLTREYNLSARDQLGADERLTQGRWWTQEEIQEGKCDVVSMEERFAKSLDLKVGDELSFDVQGKEIHSKIVNFRTVNWLSFAPNFLILYPKQCLDRAPKTAIAASRFLDGVEISVALEKFSEALFLEHRNVSLIDLRPVFKEGRQLLSALSSALSITGLLCAISGALILFSMILLDRKQKMQICEMLWQMGVQSKLAKRWIWWELALMSLFQVMAVTIFSLGVAYLCVWVLDLRWYWIGGGVWLWVLLAGLLPLISGLKR